MSTLSALYFIYFFSPFRMHEKGTLCTDIHHGFNVDLLGMAYSVFLLWQFYGERSITVTLSRTVFINSDCFPSSNNFIWLTVFLFNSKIYKLLGRSDGLQHTCCSFFCNCRLWLIAWPFFSRNLFFSISRASPSSDTCY